MVREETGPPVPELARRMTLTSCALDPVRALVAALTCMPAAGIRLGDILDDSGYAHRDADAWAIPLRQAGAQLIQDLHPHGRGPRGTHHGAVIANGNLYCPMTPKPLLELGPLPGGAPEDISAHNQQTAELAKHKLGQITADDTDGYHRVMCPARHGQDPLPSPAGLNETRPRPARDPHTARAPADLLHPADHHRPPAVAAKTRQKHDYPSKEHRISYARRTGAERTFSTIKDPATTSIARGWCRLTGLTPLYLWLACLLTIRNQRILHAFEARQAENTRRAAAGLPPKPASDAARPSPPSPPARHNQKARPALRLPSPRPHP